jgi:hypothetical protein
MKDPSESRLKSVDNSNPYYNPKLFRGTKQRPSYSLSSKLGFGVVFIAIIVLITIAIETVL